MQEWGETGFNGGGVGVGCSRIVCSEAGLKGSKALVLAALQNFQG